MSQLPTPRRCPRTHRPCTSVLALPLRHREGRSLARTRLGTLALLVAFLPAGAVRAAVAPLPCDAAVVRTLVAPADRDTLTFAASGAEQFQITMIEQSGTPGFVPAWRILDALGNELAGWTTARLADRGPFSDPDSPYQLEVRDWSGAANGTYVTHLQRLTAAFACESLALPCDVTVSGTIAAPVDDDLFSFTASEGEVFWVGVIEESGAGFDAGWRVLDASGTEVVGWWNGVWRDFGPLPASGSPYRIQILEWNLAATGTYNVHLQRATAAFACESTPLPCDGTLTGTIDTHIDDDLFSFPVSEGEVFWGSVLERSGAGFDAEWRVLDAAGAEVVGWWNGVRRDFGPLPASGSPYRIQVRDRTATATGTYEIHVQRTTAAFACEAIPLPCDATLAGTIETRIDDDLFSFSASDGEIFYGDVIEHSGAGFDAEWRVLDAAGTTVVGWWNGVRRDFGPLPASGSPYRIQVEDRSATATGTYEIHLQRMTAAFACEITSLPCDVTLTGTIDTNIDNDLFSFPASDGEMFWGSVLEQVGTPGFDAEWRVLDATGAEVVGWWTGIWRDFGPLPAAGSPYRIQVLDHTATATGTYMIHLQRMTADFACETTPLPCDTAVRGTIQTSIDDDLFAFEAAEGEILFGNVLEQSGTPGFDAGWRVLDATGTEVVGWWNGVGRDFGPLPASGSPYRIQVLDWSATATGAYDVHLQRLTAAFACEGIPLSCDSTVVAEIDTFVDGDLFEVLLPGTFPDSLLSIPVCVTSLTEAAIDPVWRLIDGAGSPVSPCAGWASGCRTCAPLGANGPYRVHVIGNSATQVGTYSVQVEGCGATAVQWPALPSLPVDFVLGPGSPNPASARTTVTFAVPRRCHVALRVFNVRGAQMAALVDGEVDAGYHVTQWDTRGVASGVYFYRMQADGVTLARKLSVVR